MTLASRAFQTASVKWRETKARRSAGSAANSASAEARTGTRTASSARAPAAPSSRGRTRRAAPSFF